MQLTTSVVYADEGDKCNGKNTSITITLRRSDAREVSTYNISITNNSKKAMRNLLVGDGKKMMFRPNPELEYIVTGSPAGWTGEFSQKYESIYGQFFWFTPAKQYLQPGKTLSGFQIQVRGVLKLSGNGLGNDGLPYTGSNISELPYQVNFRGGGCAWGNFK